MDLIEASEIRDGAAILDDINRRGWSCMKDKDRIILKKIAKMILK